MNTNKMNNSCTKKHKFKNKLPTLKIKNNLQKTPKSRRLKKEQSASLIQIFREKLFMVSTPQKLKKLKKIKKDSDELILPLRVKVSPKTNRYQIKDNTKKKDIKNEISPKEMKIKESKITKIKRPSSANEAIPKILNKITKKSTSISLANSGSSKYIQQSEQQSNLINDKNGEILRKTYNLNSKLCYIRRPRQSYKLQNDKKRTKGLKILIEGIPKTFIYESKVKPDINPHLINSFPDLINYFWKAKENKKFIKKKKIKLKNNNKEFEEILRIHNIQNKENSTNEEIDEEDHFEVSIDELEDYQNSDIQMESSIKENQIEIDELQFVEKGKNIVNSFKQIHNKYEKIIELVEQKYEKENLQYKIDNKLNDDKDYKEITQNSIENICENMDIQNILLNEFEENNKSPEDVKENHLRRGYFTMSKNEKEKPNSKTCKSHFFGDEVKQNDKENLVEKTTKSEPTKCNDIQIKGDFSETDDEDCWENSNEQYECEVEEFKKDSTNTIQRVSNKIQSICDTYIDDQEFDDYFDESLEENKNIEEIENAIKEQQSINDNTIRNHPQNLIQIKSLESSLAMTPSELLNDSILAISRILKTLNSETDCSIRKQGHSDEQMTLQSIEENPSKATSNECDLITYDRSDYLISKENCPGEFEEIS